ncbi:class I SAM-dependent rRNA methyltransferase [Ureibacillus sinduriensis]|uniref:50S rRNA methyltransferase n=1 Tax=Ureibacillus sinduriensis BLB-1 = JCM 15800 TaxID=1384057 RepID=A0A0A3I0S6_9BACL|nr:class I SAM-dependent rRNA methyltransferase [Ureibacillus sinduriensis]KGR78431.1 50S rRNA methyltransferase [Ureibacillus sinduriensis BLB-1 = JCM 15800]
MNHVVELMLKPNFVAEISNGYPLILKEAAESIDETLEEGTILKIVRPNRKYIATGYYGKQNKGIGWVLTNNPLEEIDEVFFEVKFKHSISKRDKFYKKDDTTAFRVFNGEGDGIGGLTIDYFDGFYLVSFYSRGIYSFRDAIFNALKKTVNIRGIYEKKRFDTNGQYVDQDDYVEGEVGQFPLIIKENGMNFAVNLNDGAMTGIFLDQRNVRLALREHYSKGKTVLNTFSYTGAFSVAAALGGAYETTSVDLAKRSLPMTIEQFSVNGIDYEQQQIKVMNVFDYFSYAARHQLKYDVVVLDPPSFARTKKMTFSTAKDYPKLIAQAIEITAPDGLIIASTNNASFNMKKFKTFIDKAFKEKSKRYKIVEQYQLPDDFATLEEYPEFNYLKVCMIQLLK